MNAPDLLLRGGLALNAAGHSLECGLRRSTTNTIRGLAGTRHEWARRWDAAIRRSCHHHRAALTDDCFTWIFDPARRWFRSGIARGVSARVHVGATPASAVAGALLEREDARARDAIFKDWCRVGRRLYRPDQVSPFLPRNGVTTDAFGAVRSLAAWVNSNVAYILDERKWGLPDRWQSPATTLSHRSGDCEDMALVVWSAAPLLGLPRGRLVIGQLGDEGHAWVEFPTLGLWVEATDGHVGPLVVAHEPGEYRPWLYLYADGRCDLTGLR